MKLPIKLIVGLTFLMAVVLPSAVVLVIGGIRELRTVEAIVLLGLAAIMLEYVVVYLIENRERSSLLPLCLYAAGFGMWGISKFIPRDTVLTNVVFTIGCLPFIGAMLASVAHRTNTRV